MKYRKLGKLDMEISALGFGTMRLPLVGTRIDEEETTKMVHYAIDYEINYFDTAYPYHDTKCRYCMPCPNDVDIPRNLELYNEGIIYDKLEMNKVNYNFHMPDKNKACCCIGCGICEDKCPQHIMISGCPEFITPWYLGCNHRSSP